MNEFGFARISCVTPRVHIQNPKSNRIEIVDYVNQHCADSDVILTPELSVSSYSAGKIFHNIEFQRTCKKEVMQIAAEVPKRSLTVVGLPLTVGDALFNVAIALNMGKPIGAVPKEFVPNYHEFEEGQWFAMARETRLPSHIDFCGHRVPFSTRLLFASRPMQHIQTDGLEGEWKRDLEGQESFELKVFIEICEAIWMIIPPSSFGAIAGANVLLNPSSSTETVGKQEQRRYHVLSQSSRCQSAYAYCSSGPTESSSDTIMGGHDMIAEGGHMCEESARVGDGKNDRVLRDSYHITADVDIQKLMNDRRQQTSFTEAKKHIVGMSFTEVPFEVVWREPEQLKRPVAALPFVPRVGPALKARCAEIFGIQKHALMQRFETLTGYSRMLPQQRREWKGWQRDRLSNYSIGISGGLDSTYKAIVMKMVMQDMRLPFDLVRARTMPGWGTSSRTKENADRLMENAGFDSGVIDIKVDCLNEYKVLAADNGYKPFGTIDLSSDTYQGFTDQAQIDAFMEALRAIPKDKRHDLIFENVQARRRTEYLMNLGTVMGTGDMSELFLGWCTYNADHQSMYNANCSIPKTLIKFLVEYVANNLCQSEPTLRDTLLDIAATPISPELLPLAADGTIEQSTEDMIGPYELIDFLMFHTIRNGFSPAKILYLGDQAEGWMQEGGHSREQRKAWHQIHYRRFFQSQFKRDDVPNGVKVGSVSLSPRSGNWRMPSDGEWGCFADALEVA